MIPTVHSDKNAFVASKPKIQSGQILIQSYVPASSEHAAPYDQVWCKMKTGKAIDKADFGVKSAGGEQSCAVVNKWVWHWVEENVTDAAVADWINSGRQVNFLSDSSLSRGDQWVSSEVTVAMVPGGAVSVRSTALVTAEWVPLLGGNHYCKLLSPAGVVKLMQESLANAYDLNPGSHLDETSAKYEVNLSEGALYASGNSFTVTVNNDPVDIFVPRIAQGEQLIAAILMQGAKVDKSFYSNYAQLLGSYGFIVAIPNHKSLLGNNFTEQKVFNQVWDYLKKANQDAASALYNRLNSSKLIAIGHSFGGSAVLNILQQKCGMPTCVGSYRSPAELSSVVVYGTNTKTPLLGGFSEVKTRSIPLLYLQGERDGKAMYRDTLTTFEQKTVGTPRIMITLTGANHYGICNKNNPDGADADQLRSEIDQSLAVETLARWSGQFLRTHNYRDEEAAAYIYQGQGQERDSRVKVVAKVSP
jgi:dienelactone hydrolase